LDELMTRPPSRTLLQQIQRRSCRSGSGFTLLETSIALGILAVGVLGVAAAMVSAMTVSSQSRARTQASYLAGQQLEVFRVTSEAALLVAVADGANAHWVDPDPGDADTTRFNRRWLIAPDTPENGVYTVTVFVDWVDGLGVTRTAQLRTVLAPS
jgi:prepilin-type N-terminal cleavage/methylation domain-containing protein